MRGGQRGRRGDWSELTGLVWRADCLCCGVTDPGGGPAGGEDGPPLCRGCIRQLRGVPSRVPVTGGPPVFTAGPYGGAHRGLVLAAKEHLRPGAVEAMGAVLAGVVRQLVAQGVLPDPRLAPLVLLPAPTTLTAARNRGGCVVERAAGVAAAQWGTDGGVSVVAAAHLAGTATDSVGLDRAERRANIAANLRIDPATLRPALRALRTPGAAACIVDDVTTTGATLSRYALGLASHGVRASAAAVVARA